MKCPNCGRKIADGYEYCPKCGKRLDGSGGAEERHNNPLLMAVIVIGSAVVGWGLAFGGYAGDAAVQSASALFAIKALYTWVPMILIIVGTVILAMCNLDKIYPTISKDLAARRQQ